MLKNLIKSIKNSTIFLWFIENWHEKIIGTWFLLQVKGIFHLVTAKHVVEKRRQDLHVFLNSKQFNNPKAKSLSRIYTDWFNRISHNNKNVDIAILPFLLETDDNIEFIPDSLILDKIDDICELVDVFYTSFQPWLNSFQQDWCVNPIIRKWTISRINNNNTFFIDWSAFPGNSWSPIFLFPTPIDFSETWTVIWWPIKIKLLWVMGAYIPYEDVAISQQTWRPKVIFEENTWLSLIHSAIYINEIINSDLFQKQLNRLLEMNKPTPIKQNINPTNQNQQEKVN